MIEKEQYISAQKLSKSLFVSLPTIRRDLAELKKRNLIERSHGGAKRINDEYIVVPVNSRKNVNSKKKRIICRCASKLIKDNSIYLCVYDGIVYG